ncbi:hypothetical protein [Asticcacaulis sp.]|uniref:hypothetical protein n=1 Tax=Asticcacaulis sp. TaxID=1872648 RepID=UPI00391C62CA
MKSTKIRPFVEKISNLFGPLVFSLSGFVVSVLVQRSFSAADFGVFAFIQVLLATGMALSNGLISIPSASRVANGVEIGEITRVFFPVGVVLCGLGALLSGPIILSVGAHAPVVVWSVLLAFATWVRYLCRSLALVGLSRVGARNSDLSYGITHILLCTILFCFTKTGLEGYLSAQTLASVVALVPVRSIFKSSSNFGIQVLRSYQVDFHKVGIWAFLTAFCGQVSASAHAYITSLFLSPAAFAPLAIATLVYRPLGVILTGVMQYETPKIASAFKESSQGNVSARVKKLLNELFLLMLASWAMNTIIAGFFVAFSSNIISDKSYDMNQVNISIAITGLIVLIRALREPHTAVLAVTGSNKNLAQINIACAIVTLLSVACFAYYFAKAPALTLLGPAVGEGVNYMAVKALSREWSGKRVG